MKTKKTAAAQMTIGLDRGDRCHHACVLDAAGEIRAEEAIAHTREVLTAFSARYPGATFVREGRRRSCLRTTVTNRWLGEALPLGNLHEVSRQVTAWTRGKGSAQCKQRSSLAE